eukprot:351538-Chlamydomonas_euryale.AAC.7
MQPSRPMQPSRLMQPAAGSSHPPPFLASALPHAHLPLHDLGPPPTYLRLHARPPPAPSPPLPPLH